MLIILIAPATTNTWSIAIRVHGYLFGPIPNWTSTTSAGYISFVFNLWDLYYGRLKKLQKMIIKKKKRKRKKNKKKNHHEFLFPFPGCLWKSQQ